jgi:hypothetical protein
MLLAAGSMAAFLVAGAAPARANLAFNITWDPSLSTNDAANMANVESAFNYAAGQLSSLFSNNVTMNITVAAAAGTGILGQSSTNLDYADYSTMRSAALANNPGLVIPATDPVAGTHNWVVSTAQEKALGLAPYTINTDGIFTFGAGWNYTYDPNNRAVPGEFDFIGIAEHEISEILGRIPGLGNTGFGDNTPDYLEYDLFRYTGSTTNVALTAGSNIWFSTDGGITDLKEFNTGAGGSDPQDWASGTDDSFNAFSSSGVENDITPVDIAAMQSIGYTLTPEPATFGLISVAVAGMLIRRSRRQVS